MIIPSLTWTFTEPEFDTVWCTCLESSWRLPAAPFTKHATFRALHCPTQHSFISVNSSNQHTWDSTQHKAKCHYFKSPYLPPVLFLSFVYVKLRQFHYQISSIQQLSKEILLFFCYGLTLGYSSLCDFGHLKHWQRKSSIKISSCYGVSFTQNLEIVCKGLVVKRS